MIAMRETKLPCYSTMSDERNKFAENENKI